eukprot:2688792-Pleurochrysis_carterae.AAC.1
MALQSMPTAYATSGRVWVEQYSNAPTRDWYEDRSSGGGADPLTLAASAASTSEGRSSEAGAWLLWKDAGTPSGRYVST